MVHHNVRPYVEIITPKWLAAKRDHKRLDAKSIASSSRVEGSSTTVVQEEVLKDQRKTVQIVDCVEIRVQLPQKRRLENASTEPSRSPTKRRKKLVNSRAHSNNVREPSPTASEAQLPLRQSPTASDIANNRETPLQPNLDHSMSPGRSISPEFPDPQSLLEDSGAITPASRPYTPLTETFTGTEDYIPEDGDLEIPGEINPGIIFEDDEEIVPVRVLNNFAIYQRSTKRLISLASLNETDLKTENLGATGIVKPWFEPEEDDESYDGEEDDDYPCVKLSQIVEFDIHHYNLDDEGTGSFDGKIYIRTKYAWYILDRPLSIYMPYFQPFFIQHRLCHLILSQLFLDKELTTNEFVSSLELIQGQQDGLIPNVTSILDRTLNSQDLRSRRVRGYLATTIQKVLSLHGLDEFEGAEVVSTITSSKRSQAHQKTSDSGRTQDRSTSNMELQVLKHNNDTVVTPIVERIVRDLYDLTLEVAGTSTMGGEEDEALIKEIQNVIEHHEDPKCIRWGKRIMSAKNYYESVSLDGVVYTIGDDVMVSIEKDEMAASAPAPDIEDLASDDERDMRIEGSVAGISGKGNYYANHVWFCKISYFFDDYNDTDSRTGLPLKKFHGQWFNHGHKTYLQETAHSRGLFLLPKCDDNPVAAIFRRCKIRFLGPGENEEVDDKAHMGDEFHCALMLDEVQNAFVNIPTDDDMEKLCESQPDHKKCVGCALRCQEEDETKIRKVDGGFSRYGVDYHVHDFVYVATTDGNLLEVAQILKMKLKGLESVSVTVRSFSRRDDIVEREGQPTEEKRLVSTQRKMEIDFRSIDSKCFVRPLTQAKVIKQWTQNIDHWFFNEEETDNGVIPISTREAQVCNDCLESRLEELKHFQDTLERRGKLRGLELFSGGGGMGTGMNYSGIVDTQWAVEFSPASAKTYQMNHPQTKVYCQDSNLLLKHAIEHREGKHPKRLESNFSSKLYCPEMPKRGQVDFIFGGPPCQAFSGANHSPKADDVRSSLPCNMLSYVEEFEPDYFLLENVTGFLRFPLRSKNIGKRLVGGIKMGVVKMVVRVLIALGYQVQFKILEAGQYGAPQSRQRIIFWGAKRGLKLPDFPVPTHAFPKTAGRWKLPCEQGKFSHPATRTRDPDHIERGRYSHAPLKNVTVFDAISDLPPFDWIDPHKVIPWGQRAITEAQARSECGIIQCDAVGSSQRSQWSELPGFPNGVAYTTPPLNAYQNWMREKMEGQDVQAHVTHRYGSKAVESTVNVPLNKKANHRDLPICLQPPYARPGTKHENKSFYARGDGSYFSTALTEVAPQIKGVVSLHPSQKRVYTIRETARSQGFPDHYIFCSENKTTGKMVQDMYRQIGNAVPVPLARALGMALGEALKVNWEMEEKRGGSPVH
ncbi:S-adenosyl-L-methionine-dependent methyltransferase [Marasmius fiardii PR-910]|nr:S-adenosyl-L-methionine-dependent methyltransferase [Marasmius fiardii PR-910]